MIIKNKMLPFGFLNLTFGNFCETIVNKSGLPYGHTIDPLSEDSGHDIDFRSASSWNYYNNKFSRFGESKSRCTIWHKSNTPIEFKDRQISYNEPFRGYR